jgi:predicted exporter
VRVCAALAGVDYRTYREQLRRGERSLTQPEIEQAMMMLTSVSRAPSTQRLDEEGRRSHLTVFIRAGNYSRIRDVLALASRPGPESSAIGARPVPFGDGWISYLTVHSLVLGEVRAIALAIVFDLLLTLVLFRSLSASLMSVLPVAVSVLLVLGTLAALDIPLGTANSMFACIALGIGIDYAIHLVAQYRVNLRRGEPRTAALLKAYVMTGPAVITSAIAIISGFMVLALSSVPPNRVLGILVCFAMALCAGLTLLLVPSCVLLRKESV